VTGFATAPHLVAILTSPPTAPPATTYYTAPFSLGHTEVNEVNPPLHDATLGDPHQEAFTRFRSGVSGVTIGSMHSVASDPTPDSPVSSVRSFSREVRNHDCAATPSLSALSIQSGGSPSTTHPRGSRGLSASYSSEAPSRGLPSAALPPSQVTSGGRTDQSLLTTNRALAGHAYKAPLPIQPSSVRAPLVNAALVNAAASGSPPVPVPSPIPVAVEKTPSLQHSTSSLIKAAVFSPALHGHSQASATGARPAAGRDVQRSDAVDGVAVGLRPVSSSFSAPTGIAHSETLSPASVGSPGSTTLGVLSNTSPSTSPGSFSPVSSSSIQALLRRLSGEVPFSPPMSRDDEKLYHDRVIELERNFRGRVKRHAEDSPDLEPHGSHRRSASAALPRLSNPLSSASADSHAGITARPLQNTLSSSSLSSSPATAPQSSSQPMLPAQSTSAFFAPQQFHGPITPTGAYVAFAEHGVGAWQSYAPQSVWATPASFPFGFPMLGPMPMAYAPSTYILAPAMPVPHQPFFPNQPGSGPMFFSDLHRHEQPPGP